MKVLVVEDSPRLRQSLEIGLNKVGFTVDTASDGKEGVSFIKSYNYDVIVLDIMLPKLNGFEILRIAKDRKVDAGILMLTARDQVSDRVKGLEMGADDYLCKPFAFEELVARIKTITRRQSKADNFELVFGDIKVDLNMKHVEVKEHQLSLTPTEYAIIEQLALSAGKVIPFETLQDKIRTSDKFISRNALEVNVSHIRKKINKIQPNNFIQTKRGTGYFINR
ncbi:MAG: response regulator transcription factor [Kangiellaceae bacterium]|nr:response regulator transcription factor [Kangiellaceae bacterium]MCW9000843.1 response regulator transcription factor [Kangiellaceae bacterium]